MSMKPGAMTAPSASTSESPRCARAYRNRRGAQLRPRSDERRRPGQTRIVDLRQIAARTHMRIFEHLLRREYRCRGNSRGRQLLEGLRRRALGGPARGTLAENLAVLRPQLVRAKSRVGEPVLLAHQAGPALIDRLPQTLQHDPAVACPDRIRRAARLAPIPARDAVSAGQSLLREHKTRDRKSVV